MKVLICDDQVDRCEGVKEAIGEAAPEVTVTALVDDDLTAALVALFESVKGVLDRGSIDPVLSPFSDVDLVILDNNLAHLQIKGARLTAESIAGYLRVVSPAYVVSVNKNPEVDFDLRFLVGDYTTRADLALNAEHLGNRAVWTGKPGDAKNGFIPWYWPALLSAPSRRRLQIEFLKERLDDKLITATGMPRGAADSLSRHAQGVLGPEALPDGTGGSGGRALVDISFREFLEASSRSLPAEDERKRLGASTAKKAAATVLAADLDWWFRRDVMGPQETLVDLPHLLSRMPFLLGKRASDTSRWNAVIGAATAPYGLDETLYRKFLEPQLFAGSDIWVGRPAFWWPELRDNVELNGLFSEGDAGWPDVVFCEDVADFVARDAGSDGPREFVAEFESPWDRRYVKQLRDTKYAPRSRLAV